MGQGFSGKPWEGSPPWGLSLALSSSQTGSLWPRFQTCTLQTGWLPRRRSRHTARDYLLEADGMEIPSNQSLAEYIGQSAGEAITFKCAGGPGL